MIFFDFPYILHFPIILDHYILKLYICNHIVFYFLTLTYYIYNEKKYKNIDPLNKNRDIERVSRLPRLTHMEQMKRAYNSKNNIYFDEQTGTMNISGTHLPSPSNQFSVRDLISDIKVPFSAWFESD